MATQSTFQIVNSAPNNPEKIFQLLNLPITRITDVEVRRNGRSRVFKYREREVYSPEIVAVVYYESLGHIASWNEGLAFLIVQESLDRLIGRLLHDQMEYVGIKDEARLTDTKWDSDNRRTITRAELLKEENLVRYERSRRTNEELETAHLFEKKYLADKDISILPTELLLNRKIEDLRYVCDIRVAVRFISSPEDLIAIVYTLIDRLRSDRTDWLNELRLPEKTGDKTDNSQKFINEWTLKFARQMIEVCDFDHLLEVLYRCDGKVPRWDLSLIDKDSKQLRFVEVKWEDKFTSYQLKDLPRHIDSGGSIELCKIIATDVME